MSFVRQLLGGASAGGAAASFGRGHLRNSAAEYRRAQRAQNEGGSGPISQAHRPPNDRVTSLLCQRGLQKPIGHPKAAYESEPDRFCAVGEIGLDLYWDKTTLDIQIDALNTQLDRSVEWTAHRPPRAKQFQGTLPVLEAGRTRRKASWVFHCLREETNHQRPTFG